MDSSNGVPLDETRRSCPCCSTRMSINLHVKHSFVLLVVVLSAHLITSVMNVMGD